MDVLVIGGWGAMDVVDEAQESLKTIEVVDQFASPFGRDSRLRPFPKIIVDCSGGV